MTRATRITTRCSQPAITPISMPRGSAPSRPRRCAPPPAAPALRVLTAPPRRTVSGSCVMAAAEHGAATSLLTGPRVRMGVVAQNLTRRR
jgi:hypothetical protein